MIEVVTVILFGMLAVTAIAAIRLHDLFAVVMMFSIYSLLAAAVFVAMDARSEEHTSELQSPE